MNKGAPAFGRIKGAGKSSLRARDAMAGKEDGRGGNKGNKVLLNGGMKSKRNNQGNFIVPRDTSAAVAGESRAVALEDDHALDAALGFELFTDGPERLGWLLNFNSSQKQDTESGQIISVVNCYFQCQDGSMFKAQIQHAPYFYVQVRDDLEQEVDAWLRRKFSGSLKEVEIVEMEDLDLKNHLSGLQRRLLKLSFWNVEQLVAVRKELSPIVARNRRHRDKTVAYDLMNTMHGGQEANGKKSGKERMQDGVEAIEELREFDVPYHVRFAIDTNVRAGHWFTVKATGGKVSLERREDLIQRAEPRICAFDIETTKLPLQFPNADYDQVFMISYMLDRQGYLLINRQIVSEDIEDFEYTPKPEFEGPFKVINCANEAATLRAWFDHMRAAHPAIYVTYNGDYFDWPFIETRAAKNGMNMLQELGFRCNKRSGECLSRAAVHMDCLHWVNRDSYLPQGSRGLKAVTKYKLGYDPVEVDPEDMVRFAAERPQAMAAYSVSDAVATYYLYMTYIHPFIFSLSTIIPMPPDEVLRKGSGTLCEALLMVQAAAANIVAPNKHSSHAERMHDGHLLESETYIGGKVEALESGVFRADLSCRFRCKSEGYQRLIDKLDADLQYALHHDATWEVDDVENYDCIRDSIAEKLADLRDRPIREEPPLIYHLDVAAMYPNIILTNRLQPSAIVTDEDCAACDFNVPGKTCLREMEWVWRGEHYAATRAEYFALKAQLQVDTFPSTIPNGRVRTWDDLSGEEKDKMLKERLKKYCQRVYKRVLDKPKSEKRLAGICQRENSFYYDTVRAFRDRRYEYKGLNKVWKRRLEEAHASGNAVKIAEASDMVVLYDSLQLAHKCILNSFYGYVMRKGARWYSMEMAGVVTHTGATIIKRANELITQLGRPLELDTDGIWCALPKSFPEEFEFIHKSTGKKFRLSYPCAMLNVMVAENHTNDQFATLVDPVKRKYETSSEMTIEFEVDGPYLAMVLPASKEEGKLIKKRYAVFNFDGSLAELKGFELKRRGELKLIKVFQGEVFDQFLLGSSLEECYGAVASVANRWLDLLDTRGVDVTDAELIDLISESSVMSKGLDEYEGRKSCAITCATRLAQFLGDARVRDKGLVCNYVIAAHPEGVPTSGRAIPVAIFSTEPSVAATYLKRWCGTDVVPEVRDIVDWNYYRERLGSAIQKIITIPAAMQRVPNPVPRIRHPDWLHKKVSQKEDIHKQTKLDASKFKRAVGNSHLTGAVADMEDFGIPTHVHYENNPPNETAIIDANHEDACRQAEEEGDEGKDTMQAVRRQEDFDGWLASRKRDWRRAAEERKLEAKSSKRRRADVAASRGVDAMFADQVDALATETWSIVALSPLSRNPGTLKAWSIVRGKMISVTINVPRVFYLNSPLPPGHQALKNLEASCGASIRPVKRTLPGGAEAYTVYMVTMQEDEFQAAARGNRLDEELRRLFLASGGIAVGGVYETDVSPVWSAALGLGCTAEPARCLAPTGTGNGANGLRLTLEELRTKVDAEYLTPDSSLPSGLQHMFVHHRRDVALGTGLLLFYDPLDCSLALWIVNPAARGRRNQVGDDVISPVGVERIGREVAALLETERPQGHQENVVIASNKVVISHATSNEAALKALQRRLASAKDRARSPTVLLMDAPDAAGVSHAVPVMEEMPWTAMDQSLPRLPAVGWQVGALKTAIRRLMTAPTWMEARLQAARYARLPLASIGKDWVVDAFDALFARQLKDTGHLLWGGGHQDHDQDFQQNYQGNQGPATGVAGGWRPIDAAERALMRAATSKLSGTLFTRPAVYRCVCVELRIDHLAVAAILEAGTLGEMEGAALMDDGSSSSRAFRGFRVLIQALLEDATRRSNVCADVLLRNAYRWLVSPLSRLYDPDMTRTVKALMQKLLAQLVAELSRLGAQVVYADGSSLILSTGRHTLEGALGYSDFLLGTLRKRQLFQWVSLLPVKAWHTLLFADRYNYIGIAADLPDSITMVMSQNPGAMAAAGSGSDEAIASVREELHELEVTESVARSPRFDFVLTVGEYLPEAIREPFFSAVGEFLWLPWLEAVKERNARLSSFNDDDCNVEGYGENGDSSLNRGDLGGENNSFREIPGLLDLQMSWLSSALKSTFTEKLLKLVKHIALHIGGHDGRSQHEFPKLAGSYLSPQELGTPALAFVRAVCYMYALDSTVTEEVMLLRRQLLRLLHIKEFDPEAAWRDPCKSLVVPDVICTTCQHCEDLDVCRDSRVQDKDYSCRVCGTDMGVALLEARLADELRAVGAAVLLQDLKCTKCATSAADHLQRRCDLCGGQLKASVSMTDARQLVQVFEGVARHHDMETLLELCRWYLDN